MTEERRAIAAGWRVLTSTGEEQIRALSRLIKLTSFDVAFDVWLMTKPEPKLVERVIHQMMLRSSPLFNVELMKERPPVDWSVVVNRYSMR